MRTSPSPQEPSGGARAVKILVHAVCALPLAALYLLAAASCYYTVALFPEGIWDRDAMTGIKTASVMTVVLSTVALALTRALCNSVMWCWPAAAMLLIGTARWIHATTVYP